MKIKRIENKIYKKIIYKIIYILLIILIIYNVCYFINNAITSKKYINIFGISLVVMPDKTMTPNIRNNDLAVFKKTTEKKLKINDIILYDNSSYMQVARITNVSEEIVSKSFTTKGDNNYYNDLEEKQINDIVGKYLFRVPRNWINIKNISK